MRSWLVTVARRDAWRQVWRAYREQVYAEVPEAGGPGLAPAVAPLALTVDAREALRELAELPAGLRDALAGQAAGYTHAELSQRLGILPHSVENRCWRARRALRSASQQGAT